MQLVGGKLQVKAVIFVHDVKNVYRLAKLAEASKSKKEQNDYLNRLILELATVRGFFSFWLNRQWVRKKHRALINDLCRSVGMLKKEVPDEVSFEEFDDHIAYLAAAVNKTPHELETSITSEQLERWSLKIIERDLHQAYTMLAAHHIPKELMEDIQVQLNKAKNRARQLSAKAQGKMFEKPNKKKGKVLKLHKFRNPNEQQV